MMSGEGVEPAPSLEDVVGVTGVGVGGVRGGIRRADCRRAIGSGRRITSSRLFNTWARILWSRDSAFSSLDSCK